MTDFCKRLLVIAAGAMVFAGASYAQDITSCSNNTPPAQPVLPGPLNLRAEGTTELVGDIAFNCSNGGAPSATGSVSAFLSAPVTSKALTGGLTGTEATLFICSSAANCATNPPTAATVVSGTVNGQQIAFTGVAFPAGQFWGRISNVRVNANAVTLSATLTTVTEQILATANNTSGNTLPATVGYVFKSLNGTALLTNAFGPIITPYTTCAGNPLKPGGPSLSFTVLASETFGGAFKSLAPPANPDGTPIEAGSYQGAGGAGVANFGTRIQLTFAAVSTGMTIYVPTSISTTAGLILNLTSSATGAFAAVTASTTLNAPGGSGGAFAIGGNVNESYTSSAAVTPTSGSVTVVYEVFDAPAANILAAQIPVWVSFAPNAFTTAQGPITVTESYAPIAAAAAATTIPNFNAPGTTVNATTVAVCQTNLLFPFVTSAGGFDTGIALMNTSTDPFGTSPSPGSCTLNYYGTGTPSPATGIAAPGGVLASGSITTFLSSSVAPGFAGYVIAVCNFQYGYGYAFIEDGLGTSAGIAEGYIAVNLQRPLGLAIIGQ